MSSTSSVSTLSTSTSSNIHEIELRFPSSIYYADPYAAIRSVLGNDIEILDYKESNIILPDSNILVNVKYSAIDFDLFKLWKIEDTKITSQQSQKVVATQLRDTITGELLNSNSNNNKNSQNSAIPLTNTSTNFEKLVIISNYSPKYKLIFIKYLDRVNLNSNQNIRYYGFVPQSKSDVLHSYCSIVDNQYLSYHGSKLKFDEKLLRNLNLNTNSKLNIQNETRSIQKLFTTGIETNNFTNLNFDLSTIFNIAAANGVDLKTIATASTVGEFEKEIDLNKEELAISSGFVNLTGKSADEIKKAFVGQRGIILLSKFRDNISTILYLNSSNNNVYITENIIDNLLLVMNYDNYNLNLWSSQ